ncbi:MAG: 2-dehydropantoate 2-reductase [Candidatus Thorarchaeota archaeon]|nr:2-dehydropantoate 2-reductase [Candidatus Thorarchaeota archaeon]
MHVVIMGAGAIGSLYGGLLSLSGIDVTLVGRPPHVSRIRSSGLVISGVLGDHTAHPKAIDDPTNIDHADFVFITTKSYDTVAAARAVRHLVDNGAALVVLQNGLGTERLVEQDLGTQRVLRATTCMGAQLVEPGHVHITGTGITEIGSHHDENRALVESVVAIIKAAGFHARSSENMDGVVWTKTLVNCGINPVGALTGLTNGEIYQNKMLRGLVISLINETMSVVDALGVTLTTDDPIRYTLGTAKATGANLNSMLQDILASKRTEIDYITGAVIEIARELGISLPVSETVYALVKALEAKKVGTAALSSDFVSVEDLVHVLAVTN